MPSSKRVKRESVVENVKKETEGRGTEEGREWRTEVRFSDKGRCLSGCSRHCCPLPSACIDETEGVCLPPKAEETLCHANRKRGRLTLPDRSMSTFFVYLNCSFSDPFYRTIERSGLLVSAQRHFSIFSFFSIRNWKM